MELDITKLTDESIAALRAKLDTAIELRKTVLTLREKLTAEIAAAGLTVEQVFGDLVIAKPETAKTEKTRKAVAPKFADPTDPTKTWTGRGKAPLWVAKALEGGKALDDLLIVKPVPVEPVAETVEPAVEPDAPPAPLTETVFFSRPSKP